MIESKQPKVIDKLYLPSEPGNGLLFKPNDELLYGSNAEKLLARAFWIESPFRISGAGGDDRLGFSTPYIVNALRTSRLRTLGGNPNLTIGKEIANKVIDLLHIQPGEVMADMGVGPGVIARHLSEHLGEGGWIYCLDASMGMLTEATKQLQDKRATFVHADIHTADKVIPEKVDAAVLSGNIHLLTNKEMALSAIKNTLKPLGRLAIVTHTYQYKNGIAGDKFATMIDNLRQTRPDLKADGLRSPMLTEQELRYVADTARKAGFNVELIEPVSWAEDCGDVWGPDKPLVHIKKGGILLPSWSDNDIQSMAVDAIDEAHRGRWAQMYLRCTLQGEPSFKIATSSKRLMN